MKTREKKAKRHPSGLAMVDIWPSGNGRRLKFINEEDFPRDDILKGLGLSGSVLEDDFAIVDRSAIGERLGLVDFLRKNPQVRVFLSESESIPGLPTSEREFLTAFPTEGRSPFWRQISKYIDLIDRSKSPPQALKRLAEQCSKMLLFEEKEKATVVEISKTVQQMANVSLVLEVPILLNKQRNNLPREEFGEKISIVSPNGKVTLKPLSCFGYRAYGGLVTPEGDREALAAYRYARSLKSYSPLLLGAAAWKFLTYPMRKRRGLRASIVTNSDISSLIEDVYEYLKTALSDITSTGLTDNYAYRLIIEARYDRSGLRVRLIRVDTVLTENPYRSSVADEFNTSRFRWLDRWRYSRRARGNELQMEYQLALQAEAALAGRIATSGGAFGLGYVTIPSAETDAEYKWKTVGGIYRLEALRAATRRMSAYRDYYCTHLNKLKIVIKYIAQLEAVARRHALPVCVPRLVEGHTVTGRGLVPMQLLSKGERASRVVPMDGELSLNGRMLAVNGGHGDGKTELLHLFPVLLYLAHRGLPVFGEFFDFNPKTTIGLCFITQRGEGSTIQILLKKLQAILVQTKRCNPHEVVVVIDELGSATQEADGARLAIDILSELHRRGVSVIYSSQIQEVLKMSVDELNAIPLRMGRGHSIHVNEIGDGRLAEAMKRSGLTRQLTSSIKN